MALSKAKQDAAIERRRKVAELRLRGLSEAEIASKLAQNSELHNPQTGKPYSRVTVHNDLVALRDEWRAESLRDIAIHKAIQLAEIREARREAWKKSDLNMVSKFLQQEINLLGTDAPIRITWEEEARAAGIDPAELFEELVNRYASAITGSSE